MVTIIYLDWTGNECEITHVPRESVESVLNNIAESDGSVINVVEEEWE